MGLVAVSLATTVDGTVIGERSAIECVEYLFKVAQYSVWFVRGGKYCVEISFRVDQSHVTAMVSQRSPSLLFHGPEFELPLPALVTDRVDLLHR